MIDAIETIGSSLIQHGPGSDGVYLMQLHADDVPGIIGHLEQLASSRSYSKLVAKVPATQTERFVSAGFHLEAAIPYFFPQDECACFMAKYLKQERRLERRPQLVQEILAAAHAQQRAITTPLPAKLVLRMAEPDDADAIASLYRELFAAGALPLHDPHFIRGAMNRSTIFLCVWKEEGLIATAGAEIDRQAGSAELGNLAVLPRYRKRGIALHLLQQMEESVFNLGTRSVFALSRAYSAGMNLTFARNGYSFGGTLTNNSNINGNLESMNLWHKTLTEDSRLAWRHLFEAGEAES